MTSIAHRGVKDTGGNAHRGVKEVTSNVYRGVKDVTDTAFAFDAFAGAVGMSQRVAFVDVTIPALDPPSLAVAPWCYGVIYVVTTMGHNSKKDVDEAKTDADEAESDAELPVIRVPADLSNIPDVYAFLHAALNCNIPEAIIPDSPIDRLRTAYGEQPPAHRNATLRKAFELQRAYRQTISRAAWGLARPGALVSPAAASMTLSPPHYFVFVRSPVTGTIYLVDGNRVTEIEPALPSERTSNILTLTVLAKLRALHEAYGEGESCSVVGILERLC